MNDGKLNEASSCYEKVMDKLTFEVNVLIKLISSL